MRTTTSRVHRKLTFISSALTIGLALVAGRAHAQGTPAAQPDAGPPPGPPPPQAVAEANPLAEQQLQQIRSMISSMAKPFVFDGYLRAGFGVNVKGGDQDAFQAPGAFSKYRLGNEIETYGEIGLTANWINPEHNDAWFLTHIKLAVVAPRNSTFDNLSQIAIREGYAEAGHVIDSHPEVSFWAGQRFYRRRDVHIIDFFFNDTSGYGAGFQDLKVGDKATLSVAYLGGSTEDPMGGGASFGRLTKNMFDIRLSNIPVGTGTLELMLIPTLARNGDNGGPAQHSGVAGGVFWNVPVMGGFNELSAQIGTGAIENLSTFVDNSPASGWLARVVDRAVIQASPRLSMMMTGVLQFDNHDGSPDGTTDSGVGNMWVSAGARPVYMFGKYTGVAVEGGIDMVKPQTQNAPTGFLGKLTVAPLIRPGMDFWARPEIRAFVTLAAWDNSIKGFTDPAGVIHPGVGGRAFVGDNVGATAGVQMESWW